MSFQTDGRFMGHRRGRLDRAWVAVQKPERRRHPDASSRESRGGSPSASRRRNENPVHFVECCSQLAGFNLSRRRPGHGPILLDPSLQWRFLARRDRGKEVSVAYAMTAGSGRSGARMGRLQQAKDGRAEPKGSARAQDLNKSNAPAAANPRGGAKVSVLAEPPSCGLVDAKRHHHPRTDGPIPPRRAGRRSSRCAGRAVERRRGRWARSGHAFAARQRLSGERRRIHGSNTYIGRRPPVT